MNANWKHRAEVLFFGEGKTIVAISEAVGVSVRSISAYFNGLPHYKDEVERRKAANKNRTAYYRENKRKIRGLNFAPCAESLKQRHIMDVRILSKERFFHE
ncbi:MAG: hypothetical protein FWC16_00715 [Defluviitaleaceae bacterium]|nr:hypothetical protein [Defluviitaleaceae bacterium]MCL2273426.1 hypothetical protein [Defluviitaleaceae bacterium]